MRADVLRFEDLGEFYNGRNVQINWNLATNRVPSTMSIYRVVPAKFSAEIISNLVYLGGFTDQANVREALLPALKGKDCLFEEIPAHFTIQISPRRGLAGFFNHDLLHLTGQLEPSPPLDEEVLTLALEIAKLVGIKDSDLAQKPDSNQYWFWRDKRTKGA